MLHVAVAVIRDAQGRILLSRRREGTHLAGLWEFPGGKVEPGETPGEALRREILEETGLALQAHRPLIGIRHHYPGKSVFLDTHLVTAWSGEAHGREGQEIAWCDASGLHAYPLPPADEPILTALRLPSRYAITPPAFESESRFLRELEATLDAGIRLLQLRLPAIEDLAPLAERAMALCERHAATLMVKEPELARRLGCGLHLRAADLLRMTEAPVDDGRLLAASCHGAEEARRAQQAGADFITLSPVQPTGSHPGAEPLGWEAFSTLVEEVNLPVYALGGLTQRDLETAWSRGAQGVAGITGIWRRLT
ncbi:MAG: Nudix family hydrolase [Gammaproteobacteria bacterium]|jgi:8-oxo-dGTP diphosphatase